MPTTIIPKYYSCIVSHEMPYSMANVITNYQQRKKHVLLTSALNIPNPTLTLSLNAFCSTPNSKHDICLTISLTKYISFMY